FITVILKHGMMSREVFDVVRGSFKSYSLDMILWQAAIIIEGPNDFLHEGNNFLIMRPDVRKMRSDVFIQSVVNQSYGSSFLSRFREILFYYMAMFDMLDTTLPRESESRLVFEKLVLGCYAFNGISCEGSDLVLRPK
ncbi:hypothetical protein ACJX0J_041101, partial [Zea mays]